MLHSLSPRELCLLAGKCATSISTRARSREFAQPTTIDEITKTFQVTAPKIQGVAGLLSKNYWMSEDGRRVGGIYVWETRADADRLHTAEWKKFVEDKYGTAPQIEYLHSPVMVDNRDGSIKVAA